ncbi:ABC transporter permease [Oligosphaera ethanolica]|uniref:ABC3 transporter permease C-terminal domain-containing protein n=1 Tax=Oligosphaera ethanolica TaxID=760260 RepID=A0AAE3VH36_9BACT|nr:ABC transporter permease [Oligosphaera ethanolica]MDQ0290265.1 hypothetical protein [Oligosphaera ethanolica]
MPTLHHNPAGTGRQRPRIGARLMLWLLLIIASAATAALPELPMGAPGSPANLACEEAVATFFREGGTEHGDMRFVAPCFEPGVATLTVAGSAAMRLYAMQPGVVRPGNFAAADFSAPLVYVGSGDGAALARIAGTPLAGAIAVLDFSCGDAWRRLLRFGVLGFIFLEDGANDYQDAVDKMTGGEVAIPRYYLAANAAAQLRGAFTATPSLSATVQAAPSRWTNRELRNLWALVPGADPQLSNDVIVLCAAMDSNAIVPELCGGGQTQANLRLLLELYQRFRAAPPARSVLFCVVNAHTRNVLGERILAWNLLTPRSKVEQLLDSVNQSLRNEEMFLGHYQRLSLDPPSAEDEAFLIQLRDLVDSTTGKNISVKEPIVDLARREVNLLKGQLLRLTRDKSIPAEEARQRSRELDAQRQHYVNVLTLFNKAGIRTKLSELDDVEVGILRSYVREIVDTRRSWSELNRQEMARVTANNAVRSTLGMRSVKLVLNLELSWQNRLLGLSANDPTCAGRWQQPFGVHATAIADEIADAGNAATGMTFVDGMTRQGGLPESHYFPRSSETVSVFQAAGPTPAFAVRNVFSSYNRLFTTADRPEAIDPQLRIDAAQFLGAFCARLFSDPALTDPSLLQTPTNQSRAWQPIWGVQVKSFKYDDFSASVLPQLPVPGSILLMHDPQDGDRLLRSGDVFTGYLALTDERAVAVLYGVTAQSLNTNAFAFDDDFITINHVIDAGDAENKMSSGIYRNTLDKTLALFACHEFPIHTRDNPAAIAVGPITEANFLVLNGRLNTTPKKFGLSGISSPYTRKTFNRSGGSAAVFMEEGETLKLLTAERVLAVNASAKHPDGVGFGHPDEIGPDFFARAAKDMSVLNHDRMKKLRGTSDELARIFLERGDSALVKADDAQQAADSPAYLRHLHEAVGAHLKAYKRMTAVTNDMLKAVVFYLALMLPFCFFAEKLLFRCKKIEQEMAAFCALFVLTFLVFRNIHPAFRVAQAPEAIFIAFVMGGLGAFVIKILHGRFEGEMQLLFRTGAGFDTGDAGFSTVGQSAMLIGVNNMKRRRIRTALTTATIVLVTFTMLAFTSISKKLSPTIISRARQAPYTGLMIHWPGNSRMDEATLRSLREILSSRADLAVRRWLMPTKVADGVVPFRIDVQRHANASDAGDATAPSAGLSNATLDAILGLPLAEDGFLGPLPLRAGRFFQDGNVHEVIVPEALAKALGIDDTNFAQHSILYEGDAYRVAGILDDQAFLQLKDINQRPILPIKALVQQSAGEQDLSAMAAQSGDAADSGVFYVDLSALLIMPEGRCQRLGGQPYSISAKLHDGQPIWPVVDELLTITNASKFTISSREPFQLGEDAKRGTAAGVYFIGEGYRTSIGGLAFLIIPLLISSTIILNTMLGSVFERKAEIAIYNAVGLNPTHIGMFFLAEAFVYSVIGSVGGYLIGQLASIVLTRTGLIQDINLNFSSLSVVYVILFTIVIVLLSTLYPSMVATRAAVPSGKRKWSLPRHDGRVMPVVFPFIYQPNLIYGINGYLESYFSRFTEASFGDLIAHREDASIDLDNAGRPRLTLRYQVALAPFDLGVTQDLLFTTAYDDRVQAYRLTMTNTRLSGQDSNWAATNMQFLEKMRSYLLHWRNLSPAEHQDFCRRGRTLYPDAPPTATTHTNNHDNPPTPAGD